MQSIQAGSRTLISHSYSADGNHQLTRSDYGNGDSVSYGYDSLGRTTSVRYEDGAQVDYTYDNNGNLGLLTDSASGRKTQYFYDFQDRLMRWEQSGSGYTNSVTWGYDDNNNLSTQKQTLNGTTYTTSYTYDKDNRLTKTTEGTVSADYTYDAWGNPLATTGSLATTLGEQNPLRYRGYVYDTETGLYYLQSRYYNPGWDRFINADAYLSTGQGFNGHNMFAYCGNNPISRYDVGGMFWKETIRGSFQAINNAGIERGIDTAAIGAFFLQMYKDNEGVYHASFDCWQQLFGYNNLYDFFFDLGTSCEPAKFPFTYNGKEYIIWMWKGDYINLGAGAELGIYTGGEPHWHVDKRLAMTMYIELRYNGATIISHSDYTWWITGFNPKYQNKSSSSLTAIFTIRFNDPGMYNAFRNSGHMGWKFGLMQGFGMATFIF